jgi:hypothetical protein
MKKLFFLALGIMVLTSAVLQGDGAFDAQVNTLKQECKDMIKDTRYEGSKVTYYNAGNNKQTKTVEMFMFLPNEYQYAISAKKCSVSLTVRLYDAAADVEERTMIKEFKGVQGKNFSFTTTELNKIYRKKVPEVERLKNLHIEYAIGSGKGGREAIVMVMGHKP